jgi:hypothetical protein
MRSGPYSAALLPMVKGSLPPGLWRPYRISAIALPDSLEVIVRTRSPNALRTDAGTLSNEGGIDLLSRKTSPKNGSYILALVERVDKDWAD